MTATQPQLPESVTTIPLDHPVRWQQITPTVAWMTPELKMWGYGEALRYGPGIGADRYSKTDRFWSELLDSVEVDDKVECRGSGPIGFGSFAFSDRSGGSVLVVPRQILVNSGDDWWITGMGVTPDVSFLEGAANPPAPEDRPRYAGETIPETEWLEAVATAIEAIDTGGLEKVVLARDQAVWSKTPFRIEKKLEKLHRHFPGCYTFLVDGLIGASPELLLSKQADVIRSVCLAGSAPRSTHPDKDRDLGAELQASSKDLHEHQLVVEEVERRLEQWCEDIEVPSHPDLMGLRNIWHLASAIEGSGVARGTSGLEIVADLHPTPAVGGAPRETALALIERLERMERGRYAAPVGWIDQKGDGDWAIALRCAEFSGGRARLFAGAGIVEGSLPETELEETRLKLAAMMGALNPS